MLSTNTISPAQIGDERSALERQYCDVRAATVALAAALSNGKFMSVQFVLRARLAEGA